MLKQLKPYLKNLAETLRSYSGTGEKINAQDFPVVVQWVFDNGWGMGYTDGYDEGEEIGFTDGYNIGENDGYILGRQAEYDRFWDNFQNYGELTYYKYAFTRTQWNDVTFRPKYDIRPTNADNMFVENSITDLVSILNECGVTIDFSQCKTLYMAFYWCKKLTSVGVVDTTATTNDTNSLYYLFGSDSELRSIEKIILKQNGEQYFSGTFSGCEKLREVRFEGVIGQSLDISTTSRLSKDSIISIVNALSETASEKKLSLRKLAVNNAFSINVDDESTYPEGSEFYTLRHSKDNWTFSYV